MQATPPAEKKGRVYLVGAGPGDPDLITLRGVECLREADVVLYDYLANPVLLEHAPSARHVCLGAHGGSSRLWTQDEINAELVRLARDGQTVVRLKGGDPAVFARGADEALALAQAGVSFEIVPGITAALAAGSCAGIPVTHRQFASAVALVAGQEEPGKTADALDYAALARFPGTLVFYMAVTTAERWTSGLIGGGKSPQTPVAIVRRCSLPDQSVVHCTLGETAAQLKGVRPPAIVIVGEVTTLAPTLDWFSRRPLFGKKVLVTRPSGASADLEKRLARLGAEVLHQSAIRLSPPADWRPVDAAIARLSEFDWLVFSSAAGVRYFLDRLGAMGADLRALGGVKLAAIGPGTTAELAAYRLRVDCQPAGTYQAESLAAELAPQASGRKFLLVRASRGREVLAEQLRAAGGIVEQVVTYQSSDTPSADPRIATLLSEGRIDWVSVTSSAIARSLVRLFGESLRKTSLVSISPLTSGVLGELGFPPAAQASRATMEGLAEAILAHRGLA